MNFLSLEEFKKTENYKTFIQDNPTTGRLKVEVFTAYQAIPISDTEIIITKDIDNQKVLFYRGFTDESGMIENILLPAPEENKDYKPGDTPNFTEYDLTAIHEGFERIKKYDIAIFGNLGIIQYVKMIPDSLEENTWMYDFPLFQVK